MAPEDHEPEIYTKDVEASPLVQDLYGVAREAATDFLMHMGREQLFYACGVEPDKTYLYTGHPGTGKSLAIKAINNQANRESFEKISKIQESGKQEELEAILEDDILKLHVFEYSVGRQGSPYINQGSKNVQAVFDAGQEVVGYGGRALIVIDEADSVIGSRKGDVRHHSEDRKVLETIMTNLQTLHDTPGMYAILMTNTPEDCDEASLRAGRIDKRYQFNLPNPLERQLAIRGNIERLNKSAKYRVIDRWEVEELVKLSDGFNYADIENAIKSAVKLRVRDIILTNPEEIVPAIKINQRHLVSAFDEHKDKYYPKRKAIGF